MNRRSHAIGYFTAPDGAIIRYAVNTGAVTAAAATIVLLGGRSEFIEKYEDTIEALSRRNYRVYTMDWRGQGLSSRLLKDRHKGHIESFRQYLNDLHFFMETFVRPNAAGPVIFLAHSMGAHIVLRFLIEQSPPAAAAVLVSPMIHIRTFPLPRALAGRLAKLAVRAGLAGCYIPGEGPYQPGGKRFKNNPLTSDRERFMEEHRKIAQNPDLAIGGVTWGWLAAAMQSIDRLLSESAGETFKTPVLIIGGSADRVVSLPAMRHICRRLPECRLVMISRARHEILNEAASVRRLFWQEFDRFIEMLSLGETAIATNSGGEHGLAV